MIDPILGPLPLTVETQNDLLVLGCCGYLGEEPVVGRHFLSASLPLSFSLLFKYSENKYFKKNNKSPDKWINKPWTRTKASVWRVAWLRRADLPGREELANQEPALSWTS